MASRHYSIEGREPFPLYPMLDDLGYEHLCIQIATEVFLIYIWPHATPVGEAFIRSDAAGETQ